MKFRWYVGLYFINLLVLVGIGSLEEYPGYMDADYYYASGLRIATEESWSEPFLWNYLADPDVLPQPGFTYWMPLAGVLSAAGIYLTGIENFWAGRLIFLLLAAVISPLSAIMAQTFISNRWAGLLAGFLAIFSGFYLVYLPNTETFSIYMILGALMFLIIQRMQKDTGDPSPHDDISVSGSDEHLNYRSPYWIYFSGGIIAGLMYMARVDGMIWLLVFYSAIILQTLVFYPKKKIPAGRWSQSTFWLASFLCLAGFLVVSGPWFIRNWGTFGTLFAPGSTKTFWLTRYDELFIFPSSLLTFDRWFEAGLGPIFQARLWALGQNLVSMFIVQGGIFLFPLLILGLWAQRKDWRVPIGVLGWLVTFLVMTFVFPFQGARGGFFHAGAGYQVLIWALIPVGLNKFIQWGRQKRDWKSDSALSKFAFGISGLAIVVTGIVTYQKLSNSSGPVSAWGSKERAYIAVEAYLQEIGSLPDTVVLVNNPPGYYAVTGRSVIVIPDGDIEMTLAAANKFNAEFLILDRNYPRGLKEFFDSPGDFPGMSYLETISDMHIYSLTQ
ncbi:MAG: hypothetical protein ACK2UE_15895 [Anaerolineales bacterium]